MTVAKFRRWLQQKIDYLQAFPDECRWQDDQTDIQGLIDEAYQYAVDLHLPEAAAACKKGPAIRRLMECLNAIPNGEVFSLAEAAEYLGYSVSGLRKIVKRKEIRFAQKGEGLIKFQKEWLDEFLQNRRQVDRSPAQKQRAPILIQPEHGFDPSLLQADAHSGSE
jgi:excisionase family DNA binding protein